MRDALKFLSGSAIVYVILAACSLERSADRGGDDDDDSSSQKGGKPGRGGAGGAGSGPRDSGIMDAITDPVPDAMADPNQSGTRLRARYLAGDDGSRQFVGWHDAQRNEPCTYKTAADGVMRCTPDGPAFTMYYGDAGCTARLFNVSAAAVCTQPRYGLSYQGCSATVYSLAPIAAPAAPYYVNSAGACVTMTAPGGYNWYAGTEVSAATFVRGTEQIE